MNKDIEKLVILNKTWSLREINTPQCFYCTLLGRYKLKVGFLGLINRTLCEYHKQEFALRQKEKDLNYLGGE